MKKMNYRTKRKLMAYVIMLPSLFFLINFQWVPFVESIMKSLTNWTALNEDSYVYVGIKNYVDVFHNEDYWNSIVVNLKFAVYTVVIQTSVGFILAFLLYYLSYRWQQFYKVALYVPVILPASVVGIMWRFMMNNEYGLINTVMRLVGLGNFTHAWLGDPKTALGSVILVNFWQYVGFTMVLYYIAMQNVSLDILESAEVDGANKFQRMIHFFLPLTMGTTTTNVILSVTGCMKSFALFYMLTGGGPGNATRVVAMRIYDAAFTKYQFYRALAMATILFVIIMALTVLSRYLGNKFDYQMQKD